MRSIFVKSIILLLISTNLLFAKNFNQSLADYYSKNKGMTETIYTLNRCAGVLVYTASMLFKEPDQQNNALTYVQLSSSATEYATRMYASYSNVSLDKALSSMENKMMQLEKLYREDAKEFFLKNGRYFSPIIKSDNDFCVQTLKILSNN